jgi:nucleotide-binding universal stress UspA family protein
MLGSTAEAVIKESGDPVLVVGPRGEPTWTRTPGGVVVCVDDIVRGKAAVMHACEWAAALAVDITILSVTHPLDPAHFLDAQDAQGKLARLVREKGLTVHTEIIESSFVAGSLVDFADEAFSSMLVMATHSRDGLSRLALGSVTMGVLNSASCPVLVIPPG